MALSNVNSEVLKRVLLGLPPNAEIQSAMSISPTQSVFMVSSEGVLRRAVLPKVDINLILKHRVVIHGCDEGDSLEEMLVSVSDRYNLYLVPGVDYTVPTGKVEFSDQVSIDYPVVILPDSIPLYGGFTVTLRNRAKDLAPLPFTPELSEVRVNLALASKVFSVETRNDVFVGEEQLSSSFSKHVVDYLESVKLGGALSLEQLGTASVAGTFYDGISQIVVVKTLEGLVTAIRYNPVGQGEESEENAPESESEPSEDVSAE